MATMSKMAEKPKLGISTCLLGHLTRYDGGHKLDAALKRALEGRVQFVPLCPEVECGFGVPREPLRLAGNPHDPRLITVRGAVDHTGRMLRWARKRAAELESENLCGFVLKAGSPSCGIRLVPVYGEQGAGAGECAAVGEGTGIWARVLIKHFPLLPVEDDERLQDPAAREDFIRRVLLGV